MLFSNFYLIQATSEIVWKEISHQLPEDDTQGNYCLAKEKYATMYQAAQV